MAVRGKCFVFEMRACCAIDYVAIYLWQKKNRAIMMNAFVLVAGYIYTKLRL